MRLALVLVLTTLVATCGQKGPLEIPRAPSETSLANYQLAADRLAEYQPAGVHLPQLYQQL